MEIIEKLVNNLRARRIRAVVVENVSEARSWILREIPSDAAVGFGNSQTLKTMDLARLLAERGNTIYDKTLAQTQEEVRRLKVQALVADWFVTGINAISSDGHIVNIDHSGNRVAGLLYGPRRVLLIAGRNKIVPTLEDAIQRARNVAAPRNARRAGLHPPCVELGRCVDCRCEDRVCNSLVVIEGQSDPTRMTVVLVKQPLGF
ncbi:MAG: lactate utilization protein [Chitinophagales bacterium]